MSFTDKVAIVTGAGAGGIGEGIARGLASRGAKVVIADIKEETGNKAVDGIKSAGGDAFFVPLDISAPESCEAAAAKAAEKFGRVDYLVNNAALFGGMSTDPLLTIDWDTLKRLLDINLLGTLAMTRATVPHIQKAGGGAITATSSTAAWMPGGHYAIAKLAINSLVVTLSRELAPLNIRINAIAPGPTDTPALRQQTDPAIIDMIIGSQAIKRLATPEDQAKAVMFLLSEEAAFITGTIMTIDGGSTVRV